MGVGFVSNSLHFISFQDWEITLVCPHTYIPSYWSGMCWIQSLPQIYHIWFSRTLPFQYSCDSLFHCQVMLFPAFTPFSRPVFNRLFFRELWLSIFRFHHYSLYIFEESPGYIQLLDQCNHGNFKRPVGSIYLAVVVKICGLEAIYSALKFL